MYIRICYEKLKYGVLQSWKCREPQLKPLHEILRSGSVPPLYFSLRWLWACRVIGQSSQSSLALEKLLRTTRAKETDDKGDGGLEIYFHEPALSIWQVIILPICCIDVSPLEQAIISKTISFQLVYTQASYLMWLGSYSMSIVSVI